MAGSGCRPLAQGAVAHVFLCYFRFFSLFFTCFAVRSQGISDEDAAGKEGLLLWCRKKTAGYRDVDPPSITNFTSNWKNGMAFCALIHKHQPHLIDYDSLDKNNAEANLELAFSVAEGLGIPRLLDVEDVNVEKPDERSIMTQVAEYFLRFAARQRHTCAHRHAAEMNLESAGVEEIEAAAWWLRVLSPAVRATAAAASSSANFVSWP